ncbi:BamA/TamA family outer membrane protein [Hymenobacter psychrophilus]|uniref:Outer membrane protein assembly factor BamA n=1 Tax=Hymenobacter psychrophilus TaxID=651662 RepID=A0A1H3EB29_9BACT|nr:hypothetical protein [Hymenobacter psychrophilus]SDX75901.1 hypothetical protein SAMN04488069_10355 [Hymenobacter psychrophilus]
MKYLLQLLVLLFWLGAGLAPAAAQTNPPLLPDSVRSTTDIRPDSLRRRFDQERMLNGLKAYTRRKTILGRAAAAVFSFRERREDQAGLDAALLDRQFERHNYKIVRRIRITSLDAFGYNITDSLRVPRNILEKTGNALHTKTRKSRVRQVLLFREGRELEPQALAESERLLRQTDEIVDARVFVDERTATTDSVDVVVITKDLFSLNGSFQLRDVGSGVAGLRDANFLGLGHQFRNRYAYGLSDEGPRAQRWAYQGSYRVPFRNFVYAGATYRDETRRREGSIGVSRDFYSINTRYAGAVSYSFFDQLYPTGGDGSAEKPYEYQPLRYNTQDAWVGRAFQPRSFDLGYESPGRIIVAARTIRTSYHEKPFDFLQSANLVLGTVGYSVRRYYKDKYLFGFGRTEDIPTGSLVSFTAGYEFNPAGNRRYYGLRLSSATYRPQRGYLYLSGEFGGFVRGRDNDWQQGLLSGELLYFTRLYHTGNFQWRHFFWQRSALGLHRFANEYLTIDGERGLRGFRPTGPLTGTSRVTLNYEATMYTPVSFLGFRMAVVGFADVAFLNATKPDRLLPFFEKPYTGIGLGLRFRNEYTAIRTIQLTLGFYPRGLNAPNGLRIFENSRSYYDFSDFSFGQPGVTRFQ